MSFQGLRDGLRPAPVVVVVVVEGVVVVASDVDVDGEEVLDSVG